MAGQGLASLFPLSDIAVMGPIAILKRLPPIVRRVYRSIEAVLSFAPDALVIIDAPEFTHAVAKRVRRQRPDIPIIDYVSPTVWAWPELIDYLKVAGQPVQGPWPPHQEPRPDPTEIEAGPIAVPDPLNDPRPPSES